MNEPESPRTYHVLDAEAVFVAGQRVGADRTVTLTEAQARYPLLSELISAEKPKPPARPKPAAADGAAG